MERNVTPQELLIPYCPRGTQRPRENFGHDRGFCTQDTHNLCVQTVFSSTHRWHSTITIAEEQHVRSETDLMDGAKLEPLDKKDDQTEHLYLLPKVNLHTSTTQDEPGLRKGSCRKGSCLPTNKIRRNLKWFRTFRISPERFCNRSSAPRVLAHNLGS